MKDEELIGYLIGALEPGEHAGVEAHLQASPDAAVRLEQLRIALVPFEAERDLEPAPSGLAVRTIARVAAHLVESERQEAIPAAACSQAKLEALQSPVTPSSVRPLPRAPREAPEMRSSGGRLRADLIVACGIAFLACGLVFSAIGKVRRHYQMVACQANLQTLHAGLVGYADTHDGYYPQIGPNDTADSFAKTLVDSGCLPDNYRPGCPVDSQEDSTSPVRYTYSLGYKTPDGTLTGLRRTPGAQVEHDLLPICADYPTASANPADGPLCAHPPLMNVLYVGGNVRMTTSPLVGPNGDDIYRNVLNQVAAGLNQSDVVLGRPGDKP